MMFCEPIWIVDFADKTYYKELAFFLHDYFVLLWGEYSSFLLSGPLGWVEIQAVFNYSSTNTMHVLTAPGKDV